MASNIYYSGNFWSSQSCLLKVATNCLFASKDRVQTVPKQPCVIFMAFSCPSIVLGRLEEEEQKEEEREDRENRGLANFCVCV